MRINTRFSVAVHILSLLDFEKTNSCTSDWIAGSVNTHPVVIRRILGMLKRAGLVGVHQGKGGTYLAKPLTEVTLLDVYRAVEVVDNGLFRMHENPNPACPVGANIQSVIEVLFHQAQDAMESVLSQVTMDQVVTNLVSQINAKS
ncbi:Rrf2 family transcriptional regulator [Desmospora activa]|uniref:BadM/Rrf2 family transcriptional regulator n=1 Tax=Desmospora activa DSM 45169 TaxID=1121389 RepID=A0A2T4ZAZ1_9BACL|nr:Rrf2 family transcriptional regulator [Desmospora activa]PTM59037.1 BadM/Rrf2 family transcriptional regulator [Desmospora activa DSM 45169]